MRRGELADRQAAAVQRLDDAPARAIRQRGEYGVQGLVLILNHMVQYSANDMRLSSAVQNGGGTPSPGRE